MSTIDFTGRVVIVTGAAGGLGSAYAAEIARRGGSLVLVDLAAPANGTSLKGLAEAVSVSAIATPPRPAMSSAKLASDAPFAVPPTSTSTSEPPRRAISAA